MSSELHNLRALLDLWRRWSRAWRPDLGYPKAVPYLRLMKGQVSFNTEAEDYDDAIDKHDIRALERCVRKLPESHQHAIRMIVLGEAGPQHWRERRLDMRHIRALYDESCKLLIPLLKREGVVL